MAIAFALAAGSLIGPGTDVRVTLSGLSTAGDFLEFLAQIGGVTQWSLQFSTQQLAVGSHTPDAVMGWDYNLNRVARTNLQGVADGTAFNLVANWKTSVGVLVDTGTLAAVWTMSHAPALVDQSILQNSSGVLLSQILAAVRKTFQNAP